jgi:NADPH-dependent 2,4-dienoyl-CoA reductase/sulfur reductase-like enzyme/rhodanese-related sulfurtransferase
MKLVIVGGVAGGASAAARARRIIPGAHIVVLERGPDASFANCGLPYYIGGEIVDRGKLLVTRPEQLLGRHALDVRTLSEVVRIDRAKKTVRVRSLADGREYDESYDQLILATGAAPLRPPLPGLDLPGIHTLRTLEDSDAIKALVDGGAKKAVVVGAGFIGLEMVENLVRRDMDVALIELQDQVLPPLDREMTAPIVATLRRVGVDVRLGVSASAFERNAAGGIDVVLKDGARLPADLVVLGIGVKPENQLAIDAGLEVGPRGGIVVDEAMRTSDPSIYAVGDAVETVDFVTGQRTQVPLGGPANRQGRIAADRVAGRPSKFRGTQGTAIVRVFEQTAAITGASEKVLRRLGRTFLKVYVHPAQHAGYYPGAKPMTIKLLFEPGSGLILGAQIVGQEGVDNRINVLALAIQARLTVRDLEEVELAYSPQYGSAKDAINMAGFVATNVLDGEIEQVHAEDIDAEAWSGALRLDVRTPGEVEAGAIPGSVHLPVDHMAKRLAELPKDRKIIAYCQAGQRGYQAVRILKQTGHDAVNLAGGYRTYRMVHPGD